MDNTGYAEENIGSHVAATGLLWMTGGGGELSALMGLQGDGS